MEHDPTRANTPVTWWGDPLLDRFKPLPGSVGLVVALARLGIGLVLAVSAGFAVNFLKTSAVWLGLGGVAWSAVWMWWGRARIDTLFADIRPAFRDHEKSDDHARRWTARLLSGRIQLGSGAVLAALAWTYLTLERDAELLWLPAAWSTGPHLELRRAILYVYAAPILILAASSLAFIVTYILSIVRLAALEVVAPTALGRILLRPIVTYSVTLGFAWSVGSGLFVLLARLTLADPLALAIVMVLGAVGAAMLLGPQYFVHLAIARAQLRRMHELAGRLETLRAGGDPGAAGNADELRTIEDAVREEARSRTWVYTPGDILSLILTVLLPLGSSVVNELAGPAA